jgi:hypothetical protein
MQYSASKTWDFTTGDSLPDDLMASSYTIQPESGLLGHRFDPSNVYVRDGFLNLVVPGGQQGQQIISSAEVESNFQALHGSVRIWAILTEEAGVCNG